MIILLYNNSNYYNNNKVATDWCNSNISDSWPQYKGANPLSVQ